MTLFTETMENQTEVEYISIYERPKRPKGRPKGSPLSVEEKRLRAIEVSKKYYYENHEYCKLQQRSYKQASTNSKKEDVYT